MLRRLKNPVNYNNLLRDTVGLRGIGSEYTEMEFLWVHEADP